MATTWKIFGCCLTEQEKSQRARSRLIDKQLAKDRMQLRRTIKILLLGSAESGKSTFLKQMRIINGKDFIGEELKLFKLIIYGNIIKGMKVLIDACQKLHLEFEFGDVSHQRADFVFGYDHDVKLEEPVFIQYVPAMVELWKDSSIRTAFDRRREFQLGDSLRYFMDNLDRIGLMNYTPTTLDILHARKATKGITEHEFVMRGIPFHFVDVGGQRSQRQRWYLCFESVTSILFLASSSEFDQVLYEDRRTNRLIESCDVFEAIANNTAFAGVSIILFLNKTDLLEEKICCVNIADYFPQFTGDPHLLSAVQQFELGLFDARRRDRTRPLFHHFTTAIDTENIKFVFRAVRDTILQNNLNSLMLQ
jgi:guanine nucleotide-binding protein subunit alpha-12